MTNRPEFGPSSDRTTQFVSLLKRHERRLNAYILSQVPDWADADEIAQEVSIRLWQQFAEYDPAADFGAWACTIAHYQILTHRKQKLRGAAASERFAQAMQVGLAEVAGEADRRHAALGDCLQRLEEQARQVVREYYAGEATVDQLARQRGRTASAIYKTLATARRQLRDCVERRLREEGTR